MMDLQEAFDAGFEAVKVYVERSFDAYEARLIAIEKQLAEMPAPKDGKDADVDEVAALAAASILPDIMAVRSMVEGLPKLPDISELVAEAVKGIPAPKDGEPGKSITVDDVAPLIADEVAKAVAAIPPAKDGESVDVETLMQHFMPVIGEKITTAVAALPPAEKGKDADPAETAALVKAEVERAVAALPVPQDGKSITVDDVRPLIEAEVSKAVILIPVPKDGIDGKDGRNGLDAVKFFRDDKGHLIVVKSDGSTDDLGEYVGKDGAAGERGKDGADGVGFDDMSCEVRDDGVYLVWEKGEIVKEARLPVPLYRGVFKEGSAYLVGDSVSFGGSTFIAERGTSAKPETPDSGWRLAVKRGRDGKDGVMKPAPKSQPVKVS